MRSGSCSKIFSLRDVTSMSEGALLRLVTNTSSKSISAFQTQKLERIKRLSGWACLDILQRWLGGGSWWLTPRCLSGFSYRILRLNLETCSKHFNTRLTTNKTSRSKSET
jgi:hypothetical protein